MACHFFFSATYRRRGVKKNFHSNEWLKFTIANEEYEALIYIYFFLFL